MRKVVYNACFGGFGLSIEAIKLARELSNNPFWGEVTLPGEKYSDGTLRNPKFSTSNYPHCDRHDPILVAVVEKMGHLANGNCADLQIAEVERQYRIEEYDGNETVMEPNDYTFID